MAGELLAFLPAEADAAGWRRFHALRRAVAAADHPEDLPEPDAVVEARLLNPDPFWDVQHRVLVDGEELSAHIRLSASRPGTPEYEANRLSVVASIAVLPGRRRRGIASGVLPAVLAFARERGARLVTCHTSTDAGGAFAARYGGEVRHRAWESRLYVERTNWNRLRDWAAGDPVGVRLESYEPYPPEELWPRYAEGYTELERHVPREGLEGAEWVLTPERMRAHRAELVAAGRSLHVLAAWDETGLAGVTEMVSSPSEPGFLVQELTAVHPRARGRGLARLLKARLALDLRDRFPEARYTKTWNAASNDAMWGINAAMGFERHREHLSFQAPVEKVEAAAISA